MSDKKGFTLIEIIVVTLIIGITTLAALPSFVTSLRQSAAKSAQNNLITIYGAQNNYYLNNGSYCIGGCDKLPDINLAANLNLNLTDNYFSYACKTTAHQNPSRSTGFTCTATNSIYNTFILTLTDAPLAHLTNPKCIYPANPSYCPT